MEGPLHGSLLPMTGNQVPEGARTLMQRGPLPQRGQRPGRRKVQCNHALNRGSGELGRM